MKIKIKKDDVVKWEDQLAIVLIEPDEFGQLYIRLESGERWTFLEEISLPLDLEAISTQKPILDYPSLAVNRARRKI